MEVVDNKMEIEIKNVHISLPFTIFYNNLHNIFQESAEKSFITEGSARILNEGNVFYNPVQQFNRDLSISVITTFSKIYQEELLAKNIKKNKEQATTPIELKAGEKHEVITCIGNVFSIRTMFLEYIILLSKSDSPCLFIL